MCLLVGSSICWADRSDKLTAGSLEKEPGWALRIIEKDFHESAGILRLRLENSSETQDVTAFGVAVVFGKADGMGGGTGKARDLLMGQPLPPGSMTEVTFELTGGPYTTLSASLEYEILSDNSAHGDAEAYEQIFQLRAHYALAAKQALSRVRELRYGTTAEQDDFFAEMEHRGGKAERSLLPSSYRSTEAERARWSAVDSVADLVLQFREQIQRGASRAETLDKLDWILESKILDSILSGVRERDLEEASLQVGALE